MRERVCLRRKEISMSKAQLLVKNANIYFVETDTYQEGSIVVNDGVIAAILTNPEVALPEAEEVLDACGKLLIPGGIDPHVHLRDPGNSERETFETGTMAAAQGGVTTLIEHPISKPPQYSVDILQHRIDVAIPQSYIDFGFVGAAGGKTLDQIQNLADDGRILGYKTFLHEPPNGRDLEFEGLTMANDYELYRGLEAVAKTGLHCLVHAEDDDLIKGMIAEYKREGKCYPRAHLETRPTVSETASVSRVMNFARETGATVEFCHISTPEAAELIRREKARGGRVYMETCPHYLLLSAEDLEHHGPFAKCNPPLREAEDRDRLWEYVADGTVDLIGSDHAPFLMEEKMRGMDDIFLSMSGFPGIDLRLPLMLTAVRQGKLTMQRCIELLSVNPARIFGLYPKKGTLRLGGDADFTIVDLEEEFVVSNGEMYTKSREIAKVYEGWTLVGKPIHTVVRGNVVLRNGVIDPRFKGTGQLVTR